MKNLIKKLSESILFKNKSYSEIEDLIDKVNYKIVKLDKNEIVFELFSLTNFIGLILSGDLTVEKILPSGKLIVLFHKHYGEIFGEVAVFSSAKEYPCNVVAQSKCEIILFSKEELFKLLTLDKTILNNFLYLISNKALYLNSKIEALSYNSAIQKVTFSLIRDFQVSTDNEVINLPFSKKTWAENLNISRASLYRELHYLCRESIIEINEKNTIKILNINSLYKLLEE